MLDNENEGEVNIIQWNTRHNKTTGIAKGIRKLITTGKVPNDKKILVLVPRKEFAILLKEELKNLGVQGVKVHVKLSWENQELGKSLSILNLLQNPEDRVALRFWLGLGDNAWRKEEYKRLQDACEQRGLAPFEILQDREACNELQINNLRDRWDELQEQLSTIENLDESELLDTLLLL